MAAWQIQIKWRRSFHSRWAWQRIFGSPPASAIPFLQRVDITNCLLVPPDFSRAWGLDWLLHWASPSYLMIRQLLLELMAHLNTELRRCLVLGEPNILQCGIEHPSLRLPSKEKRPTILLLQLSPWVSLHLAYWLDVRRGNLTVCP